jgi:sugar lactone lactonase YvrE
MSRRTALLLAAAAALVSGLLPVADAAAQARNRFDTQLIARIPAPGYPASAYPHPNGRVYVGTYANPNGDSLPSRVFEFNPDTKQLVRSYVVPGQDLSGEHGVQVATSDASGRLVLLDKNPARALILDLKTREFSQYATFADLKPCTGAPDGNCSPTTQDLAPMANYAAWGPSGELYVTDYQQGVVWRVPPGGGEAKVWLADKRLDGQMFGTTGIALAADRDTLYIAQGSAGGVTGALGTNPSTGRLYKTAITADGSPGGLSQVWESGPAEMPDGFGIAKSGRIYVALLVANQIAVIGADGKEVERFPQGTDGQNGSPAPFDSPSSAKFLGTRLMVPNQSYINGNTDNMTLLDVETGEEGLPEFIPPGAGGVDSIAPRLSAMSVSPRKVRAGRNALVRVRIGEASKVTLRLEQRRGTRWRRIGTLTRTGKNGANKYKVGLRVRRGGHKRAVSAGRYRIVVQAQDGAGNRSRNVSRQFTVVRR